MGCVSVGPSVKPTSPARKRLSTRALGLGFTSCLVAGTALSVDTAPAAASQNHYCPDLLVAPHHSCEPGLVRKLTEQKGDDSAWVAIDVKIGTHYTDNKYAYKAWEYSFFTPATYNMTPFCYDWSPSADVIMNCWEYW